jgi:hypothetical protein
MLELSNVCSPFTRARPHQYHLGHTTWLSAMLHWPALRLLADPSMSFISLSRLVSDYLPHLKSRFILGCDPFSFPYHYFSLPFHVLVPPRWSISVSFLTWTSSVSIPVCVVVSPILLGLFPIYAFKMYLFKSGHTFCKTYDEDAVLQLSLLFRPSFCMLSAVPYHTIVASNTKNASVWTSTRFPRVRT